MDDSHSRFYRAFGELVRRERERKSNGLTQEKLGQLVGLSRTSITNIERGRQHVGLHHLYAISLALKVAPAVLLPTIETVEGDVNANLLSEQDQDIVDWAKRVATK